LSLSPSTATAARGAGDDGRRSEAETFWTAFLRTLARAACAGKLVISDAHEGLKAAVAKVLHASWQRCRVHFMRNVLAHAGSRGVASSPPSSPLAATVAASSWQTLWR